MTFEAQLPRTDATDGSSAPHRLEIRAVSKTYGPTRAVADLGVEFDSDRVTAIVGGNGAGKSTLMKIISGDVTPDTGDLVLDGTVVDAAGFTPARAHQLGIRIVHQELSLAGSLTVAENFYLEQGSRGAGLGWRRRFAASAESALREAFGADHRITASAKVDQLNAGQRQMVEIARAATAPGLRVLILDEPTSALGLEHIQPLADLVRSLQRRGVIVLFITHKMSELSRLTDRIVVMREGRLVADMATADSTVEGLLDVMLGGEAIARISEDAARVAPTDGAELVRVATPGTAIDAVTVRRGEIVGLVGLQDAGQEELLRTVKAGGAGVIRSGSVSYVTGDRRREGIFPLWNSEQNLVVSELGARALRAFNWARARRIAAPWFERLGLPVVAQRRPITALSGGMQQKVLFARGLAGGADVVLLNDPTRGVDLKTKRDMYDLVREAADRGTGILWYSSEDAEVEMFDRAYAMSDSRVVAEFAGDDVTSSAVMAAAFTGQAETAASSETRRGNAVVRALRAVGRQRFIFALIGLIAVVGVLQANQNILGNPFGLGLVLSIAPVLALAALAQMFVVAIGDIDLGVGAYMSLVGTIAATSLDTAPLLGGLLLLAVLLIYPALAWLLRVRPFPALVATLALSFVYSGLALTVLPKVGGTVPAWLTGFANLSLPVPFPLILLIVVAVAGWLIIARSALGTRIRALGSNPAALASSGWSLTAVKVAAYALAGVSATLAGLLFAGIATSGDPNAADGYTLLTIACVVIGGCAFLGGRVTAVGVVLAATLLSLVGVVLGVLQVPSLFTAAATGGLLLVVMALRRLIRTGGEE